MQEVIEQNTNELVYRIVQTYFQRGIAPIMAAMLCLFPCLLVEAIFANMFRLEDQRSLSVSSKIYIWQCRGTACMMAVALQGNICIPGPARQINASQEMERNGPTALLLAATGSAWLVFIFPPFPVRHFVY